MLQARPIRIRFVSLAPPFGTTRRVRAFFSKHDDHYRTLFPFIKEGLDRGEKAIHIVAPPILGLDFAYLRNRSEPEIPIEEWSRFSVVNAEWADADGLGQALGPYVDDARPGSSPELTRLSPGAFGITGHRAARDRQAGRDLRSGFEATRFSESLSNTAAFRDVRRRPRMCPVDGVVG